MEIQKLKMNRYIEYIGLISIMLLSTVMATCPSRCVCLKNSVRCSDKSLINVPNLQRLENDPVTIDLSSNDIDFISYDDFSFDKVEAVEILYLNESKIIDIDDTAFKELINLREIDLSNNLLGQLPPDSFKHNSKLTLINLSYNLFRIMPKIISLSLEILLLRNAGIERINNDNFAQIPNLKYLNLQRNSIKFIDMAIFKDVPKLRLIQLENNHWKCTCKSVELFNFLQENAVLDIEEPIQCRSNDDLSVSFFTENGAPDPIRDICAKNKNHAYNFVGNYIEPKEKEIFNQRRSTKTNPDTTNRRIKKRTNETESKIKLQKLSDYKTKCESQHEFISSFTLTSYIFFSIAIVLAFIVGLFAGFFLLRFRDDKRTDGSSSCDYLLKNNIVV